MEALRISTMENEVFKTFIYLGLYKVTITYLHFEKSDFV